MAVNIAPSLKVCQEIRYINTNNHRSRLGDSADTVRFVSLRREDSAKSVPDYNFKPKQLVTKFLQSKVRCLC